jgi:hypothetical protein
LELFSPTWKEAILTLKMDYLRSYDLFLDSEDDAPTPTNFYGSSSSTAPTAILVQEREIRQYYPPPKRRKVAESAADTNFASPMLPIPSKPQDAALPTSLIAELMSLSDDQFKRRRGRPPNTPRGDGDPPLPPASKTAKHPQQGALSFKSSSGKD